MSKKNLWRGLSTVTASVLSLSIAAVPIVDSFRTDIDKFLGTSSYKLVTDESGDDELYTYQSDYSSTTELLDAIEDLGERMNEEGSVLLKNNGALPLTSEETQQISLLGFSSYYPVMGGDLGSSLVVNEGTDADTVDFVQALEAKGFKINTALQSVYETLKPEYTTEIQTWGGTSTYTTAVAPETTGVFTSLEPAVDRLDATDSSWKDTLSENNVMIVTIARSAGENRTYTPGTDGVDADQDLNQTDPLGLSDSERGLIQAAIDAKNSNGGKVIVLLNNASAMEIDELAENDDIDAMLQIGLPGGYGFYGVADILSGEANPSGHLTDTYAVTNANAPSAQNFGGETYTNADAEYQINSAQVEAEGIYIGYKYYETRYADTVLGQGNASDSVGSTDGTAWAYENEVTYSFGYGLSYTTFEQTLDDLTVDLDSQTVTATVTVTNTGDVAGKDVVQLYASVPYTEYDVEHQVEKSAVQLLDYAKTQELAPGDSETITITADAEYMASWDSTAENAVGTQGNYILDDGDYYFAVGNGAHEALNNILASQGLTTADGMTEDGNADLAAVWTLDEFDNTTFAYTDNGTAVENQLEDLDLNYYMPDTVTYLSRNDWSGTWPITYENLTATDEMLEVMHNGTYSINENGDTSSITFGADNGLTLADLKGVDDLDDERWSTLMDQLTLEEAMIRTAFGGTSTKSIESLMSPEVIQNDGPNGFNSYTLGQYANTDASDGDPCAVEEDDPNLNYQFGTMANSTVIAQTFSKELATEYGEVLGNYSLWANTTILWGAGVNLHRSPYNARNHEYLSEDAALTSYQAAAIIAGGNEYGAIIAPKHLALNDTEVDRTGISVFATEQQVRENELRGIQACFEKANALGVMTAYNRVGCTADNAHIGLMKNILRGEWGFKGLASEDFIMDPTYSSIEDAAYNGITMLTFTGDNSMSAVNETFPAWTVEAVSKDAELMQALKTNMTYQNYALANSNAMDGYSSSTRIESVRTWYDNVITAVQVVFGALTLCGIYMYFKARKKEA